jgi:hypothetical protein
VPLTTTNSQFASSVMTWKYAWLPASWSEDTVQRWAGGAVGWIAAGGGAVAVTVTVCTE